MGKVQVDLMCRFIEKERNISLDKLQPVPVSGSQAREFLWPLNAKFKDKYELIKTASYLHKYEKSADKAIENYVFRNDTWDTLPLHVWRILLERQAQALTLFTVSDLSQKSVMSAPAGLTVEQNTKFTALFWLHGMTLPFPVDQKFSADFFSTHPDLPLISH